MIAGDIHLSFGLEINPREDGNATREGVQSPIVTRPHTECLNQKVPNFLREKKT